MKKCFASLICICGLLPLVIKAQDTLLLTIPVKATGIRLQYKNNKPLLVESSVLTVDSAAWIFAISSKHDDYKITILNTENNDSLQLPASSSPVEVIGDSLVGSRFRLKKQLALKVYDSKNKLLKFYSFSYARKSFGPEDNIIMDKNPGTQLYKAGASVLDALYLADPKNTEAKKLMILSYYANNAVTRQEILEKFEGNKFVDSLVNAVVTAKTGQSGGILSAAFSSIGGLDVTGVTDALAKFLVKRTKQELNEVFFRRFRNTIDSLRDLQTLFPQTSFMFHVMGDEVYDYEKYLQNLREAFKEDITGLPSNFPGIVQNHEAFFSERQDLKAALLSACYVASELENQAHPGDILANYPLGYLDSSNQHYKPSYKTYKGVIQILQLVSASMRDTATGKDANYWVEMKQVRALVNNRSAFKVYLGLLRQEARFKFDSIPLELSNNFVEELNKLSEVYDKAASVYQAYKAYILRFGEKAEALNKLIRSYQPLRDSSVLEKYQRYFTASVDMIAYCTACSELPILNRLPVLRNINLFLKPYFKIAFTTADLVMDVHTKNYSAAINHAVQIYQQVRARPDRIDETASMPAGFVGNNSWERTHIDSVDGEKTLLKLMQFGSFMSAVATAKTTNEVSQTIEAFSLPPGSARIKRETAFNVALNGYVGMFAGYEKIKGVDDKFKINAGGITAPLGISASKGHSIFFTKANSNSSSSIFLSIIDIGAVTTFRFTNDEAEKVPSIDLGDILSPGIFYSFGFGKTPFSVNLGYQMGPLLRKVNLDENQYEKHYSRVSLSFCVDIPVFNFYTKTQ